ncbi:adenylosuccinate lyase family protein [Fusobacterium polymorphum]|uniref:class-II fumarase/aspartase family protein n=1 Tax=Fusobacterium nucleatum subsp. polymorphum TaxID=76857 RepID=UPI0029024C1B|nr:adenylosuccinate lyase family protein [Fusobacterium periodonticum]
MNFNSNHITNSKFYGKLYNTEKINNIFNDEKRMQRWLDVEVALLESQCELGIVPKYVVDKLKKVADIEKLDSNEIIKGIENTGHSLFPLLKEWGKSLPSEYTNYIHYGATTQDIEDTAQILEIKDALEIILKDMEEILNILENLSVKYKNIVIMARTHAQQALPTTLGLKIAQWLDESIRNYERLKRCRDNFMVSQLFGGVGTMAAFNGKGNELIELFSQKLNLKNPKISWHSCRDRIIEVLFAFTSTSGCFAKIANEIIELNKDEIGEISEPFVKGKIGSSTMPHKRNPEICEHIVTLSKLIKSNFYTSLDTFILEHERDYRGVRTEWVSITDGSMYISKLLELIKFVLEGLRVNRENIDKNLLMSKEKIMSESLMFWLSNKIGKSEAHKYIYEVSMDVAENGGSIIDKIKSDYPESIKEIEFVTNPYNYIGEADKIITNIVMKKNKIMEENKNE